MNIMKQKARELTNKHLLYLNDIKVGKKAHTTHECIQFIKKQIIS